MYRNTYAVIHLDRLEYNIKNAAANLPASCGIVAVVKADAYGHGALRCAQAAQHAGVRMLAVALAEEALPLREAGIGLPIVIIGKSNKEQLKLAVSLDLQPCVFTPQDVRALQQAAAKAGKQVSGHLKIDTGMGRIGIRTRQELADFLCALRECKNVELAGVFTHFANSDAPDKSDAQRQHALFMEFIEELRGEGYRPAIHMDNSAGTIDLPEFAYDMVRFGISMYGYYASPYIKKEAVKLAPVMEVFAEISHVKTVPAGTKIGYGSTFCALRETKVATIQIGYGDGYNRLLSNRGRMIVKTKQGAYYAPIIGRVCMDQTMIDVTDIPEEVTAADCAVVLGQAGDKQITADEIADLCGTISYEVLLDFNGRVPRVYQG